MTVLLFVPRLLAMPCLGQYMMFHDCAVVLTLVVPLVAIPCPVAMPVYMQLLGIMYCVRFPHLGRASCSSAMPCSHLDDAATHRCSTPLLRSSAVIDSICM